MAEIKSAIELAMEKTRGLVMDDKEKSSLARKELAGIVKTIFRRHRECLIDEDGAKAELQALDCDDDFKRKIVLDLLTDEFELSEDLPATAQLFSFVGFAIDEGPHRELKLIEKAYREELEKMKAGIRSRIAAELASKGISGDSIEPNVEGWPKWQQAAGDVRRVFRQQIEKWKEKLA